MTIEAFITHKQAENFSDCQDRFSVSNDTKSIAVSDGMGSTWQQKIWAQILVDKFTENADWLPNHDDIKPLCKIWREKVVDFIQHLKDTNAPENIIIRNERNLAEGRSAGATFVGIRFDGNNWNGSVLGDSCLIEWNGTEAKFHTSQDVEAFDSYPDYFDSNASKEGRGIPKEINGELIKGNYLFLVSDPFSDFLLEQNKKGNITEYIQQLLSLGTHEEFEELVEQWRNIGMHNDDTTLVIIESDDSASFSLQHIDDIHVFIEEEKAKKNKEATIPVIEPKQEGVEEDQKEEPSFITPSFVPAPIFIEEFLNEYHAILEKRRFLSNLKYKHTKKAARTALETLFKKYSIILK